MLIQVGIRNAIFIIYIYLFEKFPPDDGQDKRNAPIYMEIYSN